jgi:hypothetical protein
MQVFITNIYIHTVIGLLGSSLEMEQALLEIKSFG